jgi:two-component system chemotaxis family response regulator WspR
MDFHYCTQALEALFVAKEVEPTVILQDLVMPGTDGLDLVRLFRSDPATSAIPIIVLSSKEDPVIKSEAFRAGANDYLVKLPDEIELIARLRYHSRAYLNQRQREEAHRALRESQQQLMEANLALQRLTNVDGLTGLGNRRSFNDYIQSEWKRASRAQAALSILMIDVDYFKLYNDTYGHLAGDEVLKKIAHTISESFRRAMDFSARFGGEEFVVVLPLTHGPEVLQLAELLRRSVEALNIPHRMSSSTEIVTVSVGGATAITCHEESFLPLLNSADKALYEAKKAGRNRVVIHRTRTD